MRDSKYDITEIFILIGLCILIVIGVNSCSASDLNDGSCPKCKTKYELRGVSRGLKYYAFPNCGNEVSRY